MYSPIPDVLVIAFVGQARHGKDSAADAIVEAGVGAVKFSFSDAIAVVCRVSHGMTKRDPNLLQRVGMTYRNGSKVCWTEALYWAIDEKRPRMAVVTGARFPEEEEMLREIGAKLVRVDRLNADGTPFVTDDRNPKHEAESQIDNIFCDYRLVNQGLAKLQNDARLLARKFRIDRLDGF